MSSRNGRGRGISNTPAWMTESQNTSSSSTPHPPSPHNRPADPPYYNDNPRRPFSRSRSPPRRSRSPPRRNRSRSRSRDHRRPYREPPYTRDHHRPDPRSSAPWDNRPHHPSSRRPRRPCRSGIHFSSLGEEREWVANRARKRKERPSRFDVEPTEEQLAMEELQKATLAASGAHPASFVRLEDPVRERRGYGGERRGGGGSQPQQTRHARRLYIGHLPPDLDEEEVHGFFKSSICTALGEEGAGRAEDPILSVYINKERRFAFVEFKTMDICTACLALDGIDVCRKGKVKIKRPNDYNPSLAPPTPTGPDSVVHRFDISKLGIVSGTVPDSPNKIFIGGLPYHLNESQVMELLGAFGKVKAFHLVKAEPTAITSKGYCFVEYSDGQSVRDVAVMGLNGMDMGGGKVLSARIAAVRGDPETQRDSAGGVGGSGGRGAAGTGGMSIPGLGNVAPIVPSSAASGGVVPPPLRYVDGVDVEALLDIAMGIAPVAAGGAGGGVQAQPAVAGMYYGPGAGAPAAGAPGSEGNGAAKPVMDIANAALEAAFGGSGGGGGENASSNGAGIKLEPDDVYSGAAPPAPANDTTKTRILVLLNMVTDEDLETEEDYAGLMDEVKEECMKFGELLSMKIPRVQDGVPPSVIKKIFLEYATVQHSTNAERELGGRQFGPAVVEAEYFNEDDYVLLCNGKLS